MNIYSSRNFDIYFKDLLWREKWVNDVSSLRVYVSGLMIFHLCLSSALSLQYIQN